MRPALAFLVALLVAAPAQATTVTQHRDIEHNSISPYPVTAFTVATEPGETSDLRVTASPEGIEVSDPANPIRTAAPKCEALDAHSVRCAGSAGHTVVTLGDGNDVADVDAGTVTGGSGDDQLRSAGSVTLSGDAGDDTLDASASSDTSLVTGSVTLDGGAGDDVLTGGAGNDALTGGPGENRLDGGPGVNRVTYATAVNVSLARGEGRVADGHDTLTNIGNVVGSPEDDVIVGDAGPNALFGQDGADVLIGGDGDDEIDSSFNPNDSTRDGTDRVDSGRGNDHVEVDGTGDRIVTGRATTPSARITRR